VFGDRPQPLLEAIKDWPGSCGPVAWDALPHIQRLLQAARDVDMPVVHVTGLHPSESGVSGWSSGRNRNARSGYLGSNAPDDKRSRMYDIVDELAPIPGEAFLRKASPSAFFGTPVVSHLTQLGIDTIIVAGESTSGCVRASVVDGCTYRYNMVVVEECVFDRHQTTHAINLFDMHQKYADVLGVEEVTAWVREWGSRQGQGSARPTTTAGPVR
jgi:maleamate amidohydrolase